MFGDLCMLMVLGMWVRDLTGSNAMAGLVYAALVLPTLVAPFGGLVIDRVRRRSFLIALDVAMAVTVASLLTVSTADSLWLIFCVAGLYGLSLALFSSARSGFITTLLPSAQIGSANGLLTTAQQALRLAAPVVGAGLFAVSGARAVVLLDVASFLLSALCFALTSNPEAKPERRKVKVLRELASGTRPFTVHGRLRPIAIATVAAMLALGIAESVFYAVIDEGLGRSVTFMGAVGLSQGVGALLGGISITAMITRLGELRPVPIAFFAMALGTALLLTPAVWAVLGGAALVAWGLPVLMVCFTTAIQHATPATEQGKVFTSYEMIAGLPQLVSIVVGAGAVALFHYRIPLVAMGLLLLVAGMYSTRLARRHGTSALAPTMPAAEEPVEHLPRAP